MYVIPIINYIMCGGRTCTVIAMQYVVLLYPNKRYMYMYSC